MAEMLRPQRSRMAGVAFELESFELSPPDRAVLRGRWFGVRGRRFIRPTLTFMADARQIRMLADLDHKPWDAEEGKPWEVRFRGEIDLAEFTDVELTVTPDITIALPTSPGDGGDAEGKTAGEPGGLTRELAEAERESRRLKRRLEGLEVEKTRAQARVDTLSEELDRTASARDQERVERQEVESERDQARTAHGAAMAERDTVRSELDRALAELEAARSAGEDVVSEREVALAARDDALSQRDAAVSARDEALAVRDRALTARDAALEQRDHSASERDAARSARQQALSQRDAAVAARDEAFAERDALRKTAEHLTDELGEAKAAHGAALVMRNATEAHPTSGHLDPLRIGIGTVVALLVVLAILVAVGTV